MATQTNLHVVYADESNLESRSGDFFVYAGIAIPAAATSTLNDKIEALRKTLAVPAEYVFKFNPGPSNLNHAQFINLKQSTLEAAKNAGARMFAVATLHDIAKNTGSDKARQFAINTLVHNVDSYMAESAVDGHAIVLLDRFSDGEIDGMLRERLSKGFDGPSTFFAGRRPERILACHYSAIGQGHFPSIADVGIGSLRFAINAHTRQETANQNTAKKLLSLLEPLFPKATDGKIPELGFTLSPKKVTAPPFKATCEGLVSYLRSCGVDLAQTF